MVNDELTPRDRFLNILLLGSMIILWLSGIIMLYGSWIPWLYDLHRSTGFSFIVLLPLKVATVYKSKSREKVKTSKRNIAFINSWMLFALSLLIIASGIMWMWRLGPYSYLKQTLLAWHWSLGLLVMPFLVLHTWQNWPHPRKADILSRRNVLKMLGLVGASVLFGRLARLLAEIQATAEMPRRFTGSRGFGIFSGNNFPTTGEGAVILDPNQWHLVVDGAVNTPLTLTYKDLLAMQPLVLAEAIDGHNGWYSLQE